MACVSQLRLQLQKFVIFNGKISFNCPTITAVQKLMQANLSGSSMSFIEDVALFSHTVAVSEIISFSSIKNCHCYW